MIIRVRQGAVLLLLGLLAAGGVFGLRKAADFFYRQSYPREYEHYVREYARAYGVDENFVFAVIRTESGFRPQATSNVGARGLMQLMEDTFHWVDTKLPPEAARSSYDDMYAPEDNIRYGTFLLSYLYREFGSYETAAAAYHAGRTAVRGWLGDTSCSRDGVRLDAIPSGDTRHYVGKVMDAYQIYTQLYSQG